MCGILTLITSVFPSNGSDGGGEVTPFNMCNSRGQKRPLTKEQTQAIQLWLYQSKQWRDLALLMLGTDSNLRSCDLLRLKVYDVVDIHRQVRTYIIGRQQKTNRTIECYLSEPTRHAIGHFITMSGKQSGDYLFTRLKSRKDKLANSPITREAYALRIKQWVTAIGLDPTRYSTKTLRKSRIRPILEAAKFDYQVPMAVLGHADIRSTVHYCALPTETALAISAQVQFFTPLDFETSPLASENLQKNLTKPQKGVQNEDI